MPAIDLTALLNQVTATEGVDASAVKLIQGFAAAVKTAVAAAIAADAAANDATNATVQSAIDGVTSRFTASAAAVGDAITANPLPGDVPPPPPPPSPAAAR